MSRSERERAGRFRFQQDRSDFIAAHALARTQLSKYTGDAPGALEIRSSRFGKPALAAERDAALGVDVEALAREAPLDSAERYFTSEECAALQQCHACDRQILFFTLWTLKEAYMKATGLRLNMPPERIGFLVEPIGLLFDPKFEGYAFWQFSSLRTGPDHIAALALGTSEDRHVSVSVQEVDISWFRSDSAG